MNEGLLLVNLGSPRSPAIHDVAEYLREFLMDAQVIDLPLWIRWPLVNGLIIPGRSRASAEKYGKIWSDNGSPLVETTRLLAEKMQKRLGSGIEVRWAMRYGEPNLLEVAQEMASRLTSVRVLALYPQDAKSSLGSVRHRLGEMAPHFRRRVVLGGSFYDHPDFLDAWAKVSRRAGFRVVEDVPVIFSFHGLPLKHVRESEARGQIGYHQQCLATAQGIATRLGLSPDQYQVTYQSRLSGRWLSPFTDVVIRELAERGVRRLVVFCPSFVADCLETLEEVAISERMSFIKSGGEELTLMPSLNAEEEWVESLVRMLSPNSLRWSTLA